MYFFLFFVFGKECGKWKNGIQGLVVYCFIFFFCLFFLPLREGGRLLAGLTLYTRD